MRNMLPYYESKTIAQVAIRWILDRLPNSIALVGTKNVHQLSDNLGILGWNLSAEHMNKLNEISSGWKSGA